VFEEEKMDGFDDLPFDIDSFSEVLLNDDTLDNDNFFVDFKGGQLGDSLVHKTGMKSYLDLLIQVLQTNSCNPEKVYLFAKHFVLLIYGKRNMKKESVNISKLSSSEKEVYARIRKELKNKERKKRIFGFINQKGITKRLINYFVVHYILVQHEISYYLDRRTYPYKIIGEFNTPHQKHILDLITEGNNIVWVNLHQEYKTSKHKQGRRNLHAPYARSISVKGEDGEDYSLCELNFYIWLDDTGGFEAFFRHEKDVRDRKSEYDEQKRQDDNRGKPSFKEGKRKKRKIVLKNTDGRNYKTFVMNYKKSTPFTNINGSVSFKDFLTNEQNSSSLKGSHVVDE
jgi:hypothetical protein